MKNQESAPQKETMNAPAVANAHQVLYVLTVLIQNGKKTLKQPLNPSTSKKTFDRSTNFYWVNSEESPEKYKKQIKDRIKSGMFAYIPNQSAIIKVGDKEQIAYTGVQGAKSEFGVIMAVVEVENDPRYTIAETTVMCTTVADEKAKNDVIRTVGDNFIACSGEKVYSFVDFARFDLKRFYNLTIETKGNKHEVLLKTYIGKKNDYVLDECKSRKEERNGKMKWVSPAKWSVELDGVTDIEVKAGDKKLLIKLKEVAERFRQVLKNPIDPLTLEYMRESVAKLKEKAQKRTKQELQTQHKITKQRVPSNNSLADFKPKQQGNK